MREPVAFVFAMPMEFTPFRRALRLRRDPSGTADLFRGTWKGRPVVAVVTGMGTELATRGVEALLDRTTVARVIVVGITGAVDNAMPIGTLVCPARVVDSASGDAFAPEPLTDHVPQGTMWTTDELTTDPDHLARLRGDGVVCLDMETAAVARVCTGRGVPWSVVRVISDRASDGSVDEEVFAMSKQDGTPDARAVVRFALRRPGRIPAMVKLGRQVQRATRSAAKVAIEALELLP